MSSLSQEAGGICIQNRRAGEINIVGATKEHGGAAEEHGCGEEKCDFLGALNECWVHSRYYFYVEQGGCISERHVESETGMILKSLELR